MKLSELISHLNARLEQVGDTDVKVDVRDYYTVYGHRAEIIGDTSNWRFATSVDASGHVVLQTVLNKQSDYQGGKLKPKVTFRK